MNETSKLSSKTILILWRVIVAWMGGYGTKFFTGRLRPEVQPLLLLHTPFGDKSYPFDIV